LTGKLEARKTPRTQAFRIVAVKKKVADPTKPGKFMTVSVDTEVPYNPTKKAKGPLAKLQEKMARLQVREKALQKQFAEAKEARVDQPVLEDGAPAPPDRQEQEMAQKLYDELEATAAKKAKSIKEDHIRAGRAMIGDVDAKRQAWWNGFDDWTQQMLVPKDGWIPM